MDRVIEAFNEPGCPRLLAMYAESMRKASPDTGEFCDRARASFGLMRNVESRGRDGAWDVYLVHAERGDWSLRFVANVDGRITGLALESAPAPMSKTGVLRWPLAEETFVFWGGNTADLNQHVDAPAQRRALDLCMVDADGRTHNGEGKRNEDYFVYGKPVLAVADGTVLVAVDGVPDNVPGEMNVAMLPGNVVIVKQGPSEFALYAHLQPGSVRVRAGQNVETGHVLGLVGNSGNSSEPHLHFHVQDGPEMHHGLGLSPVFVEVEVKRAGETTTPEKYEAVKGDRVRPRAP